MAAVPPPYAPREHAQVQPGPNPPSTSAASSSSSGPEFAETTSVCLEWRLSGLRAMYDGSKGDAKSKCIKSAVFGDSDNLWEVLWYPNSGVQGGDYASLYLSCVPTPQEREQGIGTKWARKGLWWFRFEIKSTLPDERTGKIVTLATKDASDHTFAVKTANWGWQQFSKRDQLFLSPSVLASDSFVIICTIQAQPQPPAGYWLGMGLPPNSNWLGATTSVGNRTVGSGGGLSAWSGGDGASGGVAGGTTAAGGVKKVVPRDLVSAVGSLLDDELYSDVEFIIPAPRSRRNGLEDSRERQPPRRVYANKKLLCRCGYFEAMFTGGFREVEGVIEDEDDEDDYDMLSDSDVEDEAADLAGLPPSATTHLTTSSLSGSGSGMSWTSRRDSTASDRHPMRDESVGHHDGGGGESGIETQLQTQLHVHGNGDGASGGGGTGSAGATAGGGVAGMAGDGHVEEAMEEQEQLAESPPKREVGVGQGTAGGIRPGDGMGSTGPGPKKTRVMVRDAAWSTWWAVLYWIYTDTIYFAPLTSSFDHPSPRSRPSSLSSIPVPEPRTRREWIRQWTDERGLAPGPGPGPSQTPRPHSNLGLGNLGNSSVELGLGLTPGSGLGLGSDDPVGPRPVSAKAVYRLADKLDLPALKLRAFQHIIAGVTAQNIPAEVFSRFSSTFEDVRKVQVAYFLKHWSDIKKSETMMQIWQQIRLGKHVGFEEVWPLIVGQLDFRPS